MKKPLFFLILLAVTVSGCTTVASLSQDTPKNKIFSGTRMHFDSGCMSALCLDFPFSLVADIVVLPYTVPKTIASSNSSKEKPKEVPVVENKIDKRVGP